MPSNAQKGGKMATLIDSSIAALVRGERVFVATPDTEQAGQIFRAIKRRVTPAMLKRLQFTPEPEGGRSLRRQRSRNREGT